MPFIFAQAYRATELWVIDFDRLGTWEYVGALDRLITYADLRRDQFVEVGGTREITTQITADAYASFVLAEPTAARGIRIVTDNYRPGL